METETIVVDIETAESIRNILSMLWADEQYSDAVKGVFNCVFPYQFEDFLAREVFSSSGVIRIAFEQTADLLCEESSKVFSSFTDEERNFTARCVLLYVLNCCHNRKLMRCSRMYYDLSEQDTYLSGCVINAAGHNSENLLSSCIQKFQSSEAASLLDEDGLRAEFGDMIYSIASRSSFILKNGRDNNRLNVITPVKGTEPAFLITVWTENCNDDDIDDYAEYVTYLCKHNSIMEFDSFSALWQSSVGATRASSFFRLRPTDRDLQRFAVALALPLSVYEKLKRLRDKAFPEKPSSRSKSPKEMARERMIEDFMRNSETRLHVILASSEGREPERIPRRMLVRASRDLVKAGFSGLVSLTQAEINEWKTSGEDKADFMARYAVSGTRKVKAK